LQIETNQPAINLDEMRNLQTGIIKKDLFSTLTYPFLAACTAGNCANTSVIGKQSVTELCMNGDTHKQQK